MDPQFRKLGLTTVLKRGVPSLDTEHVICEVSSNFSSEASTLHSDVRIFNFSPPLSAFLPCICDLITFE
jgi:hypothetical protein